MRSISRRIVHPRHAPKRIETVVAGNIVASFVYQTNVANKPCVREREIRRGEEGVVIAQSSPRNIESIGQVSSKFLFAGRKVLVFETATTSISSCANFEQLYIYIYIWSSVDTFSSTSQTRPILVNFERVAFVRTAFQKCLFDFTFTTVFSIFNPIFLFLSLESRNEIILREPTRKLPNFRSFIFPLEITRSTMFMRSYKSSRSLVISIPSLPRHSLRFPVQ